MCKEKRLPDNEILKAVANCVEGQSCKGCAFEFDNDCHTTLLAELFCLYKVQTAKLQRYKHTIRVLEHDITDTADHYIKQFANFLIDKGVYGEVHVCDIPDYVVEFCESERIGDNNE